MQPRLDYVEAPAPAAPTVEITEDANNDGYINSAELDGQINITVTLDAGTNVGDTLVVTDQDGNELFNGTVTQDMLDNGQAVTMDAPATGTTVTVTATLTNANGDSAASNDSATLDYGTGTGAPASPTVVITEDANNDGFINNAELDGQIDATVTLGAGTAVGDTVTITDQDGNTLFSGPVTQDMLDNGINVSLDAPATGTDVVITATVTDVAGNTATGNDSATLDYGTGTGAPAAPTVVITEDTNNDGYINEAELDGQINATVTLGAGTVIGDTVTVTDQDGNTLFTGTVTQDMLDNGINVSFDAPATGTTVAVTATVTDPAGNTAEGSDNALLDYGTGTGAPASPTVTIDEDINNDGFINDVELSGQIDITVSLGAGTAVGDTLVVTDQAGNTLFSGPVTQAMLDNGLTLAIDAPATGTELVVTATITDPAGNTATGNDSATLDYGIGSGAPASPTVTIDEDINNDGFINDAELDGQINITVELGEGTAVGDTLVVTDQAGNELFNGTVTQLMIDNGLPVTMDAPVTGTNVVVTATVTDPAGNTNSNSDTALITNATNDAITVLEDNTASGNVLSNDGAGHISVTGFTVDTNGDNDPESYAVNTNVTVEGGTLIINSDGSYSFTPAANWNGVLPVITYTTNTGDTATLTITVSSVDEPVIANDDTYTVNEDNSIAIDLLGNDVANDGGLAIQSINGVTLTGGAQNITVTNGTVVIAANGTMTFVPDANFNGNVSFDYVATDVDGDTDTGTVTITVNSVDEPVIANDDSYTVNEDGSIAINLLSNDVANDGGLAIQSINGVALTGGAQNIAVTNGTVVIAASGAMTFVPDANFNGNISFDYVATDIDGDTDTGTVTITVNSVDDPVIANDDSYTLNEDGSIAINLLGNDVANDGGLAIQSINGVTLTGGAQNIAVTNGTVVIAASGAMTFVPNAHFNGNISFDYVATDADGDTDTGTVTITVNSVDDPVTANDDSYTVDEDDSIAINLLSNDLAPDGGLALVSINGVTLTGGAQSITVPNGTVVIAANGSMTFVPSANYNGNVSFNYIATDIDGDTDTGTVNITVNPVNDDFTDPNESVTIVEDTGPTSGNVIGGTTSVDGPVTVQSFTIAGDTTVYNAGQTVNINGVGSIVINSNGSYTFTPIANYSGAVPLISYTLTDGSSTDNSTLTINVTATDDPVSITTPAKMILDEDQLSGGTGTEIDPVVQTQQFTVSAPDGLNRLEITNSGVTTSVTLAMLLAATPAAAIVIEGEHGTLTITDYDASTGTVTYSYTLSEAQTHSLTEDELSDNFGVTAYDIDGDTSSTTLEVGILDDHAQATLDTNGVDVLTDGFEVSGIVGEWSSWTGGGPYLTRFDSDDNDAGLDQMRWGVANVDVASGYSFIDNDTGLDGVLALNQDIVLGDFTHINFPVFSSITQATLTVNFTITDSFGVVTTVGIDINFDHNETPNSNDPEASRDIINIGQPEVTFQYEGEFYTIKVLGFIDENGDLVTTVRTYENQTNTYELIAKVVEGVGYHLPNKEGNVLSNDLGSDGLTVVGVAFTNDDGTDIFTGVGTTIQGTYGNLVLNADGTYEYQLTAGTNVIPEDATETFVYTIRDSDGDVSTTKLIIGVTPSDFNGVPVDIDLNVDGNDGNDSILVVDGENSTNPNQINANFGGGLQGTITNQAGAEVLVTSGTAYSTHSAQNVSSGAGQDHIETGSGNDIIYAGSTGDSVSGNTDNDIELSTSTLLSHHIMTGTLTGSNSIIDSDGLLLSADVTSEKADVVNAGSGDDMVYGQTGSDILYGHTGNDTLDGGKHNDAIRGGAGDDTIIGGEGDDVLRGDSGNDTFVWNKNELGTDHIIDFDLNQDRLDLSDLLQGETADNLFLYLHFTINDTTGTTTIDIDADHNGTFEQHIVLDGVDLSDIYGDTESDIINGLLGDNGDGPLIINTVADASSPSPTGPGSDPSLEENQVTHIIP